MSSWFSQISSTVSSAIGIEVTVEPITSIAETATNGEYYTSLDEHDLEWTLVDAKSTENQVFYVTTEKGAFAFVQLIHSNAGLWPTISLTYRFYDPENKTNLFKSMTMSSKFDLSEDRKSVKTEFFNIDLDAEQKVYKISITHPEVVVSLDFERVDKGFKVGQGRTSFGEKEKEAGFVSHKFWPRCNVKGSFIVNKAIHDVEGNGLFIHAIQSMMPQLVASNWNFVNFQSEKAALSMMQFKTTKQYGSTHVSQGSLVLDGKLVMVSVDNTIESLDEKKDENTGYNIPETVKMSWKGKTIKGEDQDGADVKDVSIVMTVKPTNLIDTIDIMGEIPYLLRKAASYATLKPYIYQWIDKSTAEITIGDEKWEIEGHTFQELVFVSGF